MVTRLVFEPAWPVSATLGLWLLGVSLAVIYHGALAPRTGDRRRLLCTTLAVIACTLLAGTLLGPTWLIPVPPAGARPRVHVVLDGSMSMATADARGGTRWEAGRRAAAALVNDLRGGPVAVDADLWVFDRQARLVDAAALERGVATGEATDLAAALRTPVAVPYAGNRSVVLISDGIHTSDSANDAVLDAARAARGAGIPVQVWPVGTAVSVADAGVELDATDELAFAGREVSLPVRLVHQNLDRRTVEVTLSRSGTRVAGRTVAIGGGPASERASRRTTTVSFSLDAREPGVHTYAVSLAPVPGETILENNRRELTLRILDDPIRVLVLEGHPYWDLKFLTRALASDPAVSVTSVVRLSNGRALVRSVDPSPPATGAGARAAPPQRELFRVVSSPGGTFGELLAADQLARYHVVILGRDVDPFLTPAALESLRSWISRRGGALVCARGRPVPRLPAPLEVLMPVRWTAASGSRFGLGLTEPGKAAHLLPDGVAGQLTHPLAVFSCSTRVELEKDLATVLARATGSDAVPDMPVLSVQPYGLGRVVALEGTGMWRLSLSTRERAQEEVLYRSLVAGLVRWVVTGSDLLPGQRVALRPERTEVHSGEHVLLSVVTRPDSPFSPGAPPVVELVTPPAGVRTIPAAAVGQAANLYRADLGPLPAGRYRARVRVQGDRPVERSFEVTRPLTERLRLVARPDVLARIARQTGGVVLDRPDGPTVLRACQRFWSTVSATGHRRRSAWDRPLVLGLIAGCLALLWVARRLGGLI